MAFSSNELRVRPVHPLVMPDDSFLPRKAEIAPANRRKDFRNGAQ
jgi:hypothetical protein